LHRIPVTQERRMSVFSIQQPNANKILDIIGEIEEETE
jgi:hypothetical protein